MQLVQWNLTSENCISDTPKELFLFCYALPFPPSISHLVLRSSDLFVWKVPLERPAAVTPSQNHICQTDSCYRGYPNIFSMENTLTSTSHLFHIVSVRNSQGLCAAQATPAATMSLANKCFLEGFGKIAGEGRDRAWKEIASLICK